MTVQSENSKAVYIANGTTTSFAIPFYFFNKEIAVCTGVDQTPLVEGTDYDLSGAGQPSGGEVVFKTAPAANTKITIKRNVPLTQLTTFIEGENFPARDYEISLDRLIMALQSIKETLSRCVSIPDGAEKTPEEIYELMLEINDNFNLIKQVPALTDKVLEYYQKTIVLLQNYDTKEEVNTKLASYYTKSEINASYYTKSELNTTLADYYDKDDVNTLVNNSKTLKVTNLTASVANIVADETYADYPYKLDIPVTSATTAHAPTVVFDPASAVSGNFAPISTALDGYVRIYLKEAPETETITIPAILLH
ncbi:MAG: hypothetical protein J6C85_05155 [Alphaproteobacteria bacterium]|nr:hypothetical protein [Alphaproteobacteria bacterium]